jgi:hypothetical protein
MGLTSVRIDCVELCFERVVALPAVVFFEADFAAFLSAVAAEFVDAFVCLWVDDESIHILVVYVQRD